MSRRVTGALLVLALLPCTGAVTAASSGKQHLDTARHYFRMAELCADGDPDRARYYHKAEELAELVLREDPDSAEAHFLVFAARGRRLLDGGRSLFSLWSLRSLNAHLRRALELDPRHANALAAKGGMLLDLPAFLGGDVEAARKYLERALQVNPTGSGTRLTMGRVLLREGLREPARRHLLLAAHYACLTRRASLLAQAEQLLAKLKSDAL